MIVDVIPICIPYSKWIVLTHKQPRLAQLIPLVKTLRDARKYLIILK